MSPRRPPASFPAPRAPRRTVRLAVVLAALAVALVPACGGESSRPAAPTGTRTILDATGASVVVPREIRRIVTTVPGLTAIVLALGAGDRLVAVSAPEKAEGPTASLPRVPVYPVIPAETIAGLAPDLLLIDPTLSPRDLAPLRARFPCTFASDSRTLDGLATTFARLGVALGREAQARALEDELAAARREAKVAGEPSVLLLSWAEPPSVIALGPGSLLDDMLRSVGGRNVVADIGRPSGPVASEVVVSRAPAFIVTTGATVSTDLRARWATVPAIRDGRIVEAGGDDFVQAGPRTASALRRLAKALSAEGAPK